MNDDRFKRAARLIYISLGLGVPNVILGAMYNPALGFDLPTIVGGLAGLVIIGALAYQVSKTKRWAVWTFTVLCVLGLFSIKTVTNAFGFHIVYGLITATQFVLQAYAVFVLHGPSLGRLFDSKASSAH